MPALKRTTLPSLYAGLTPERQKCEEYMDCSVVAISIACGVSYREAHAALKAQGRKDGHRTPDAFSARAIEALGFRIRVWLYSEMKGMIKTYPGSHKGLSSITTHHLRRFPEAWKKAGSNLIFITRGHMLAVKDHAVQDWSINRRLPVIKIWEVEKI